MTYNKSKELELQLVTTSKDEYTDIPLDISDIINICKEYSKLDYKLQFQVESILELGVEEAINTNVVKLESLSYIKDFLKRICEVSYFGDAVYQSKECIQLISNFQHKHLNSNLKYN